MIRTQFVLVLTGIALTSAGCSDSSMSDSPPAARELKDALVDSLASGLVRGKLVIGVPAFRYDLPTVDSIQAKALALAHLRQFWDAAPDSYQQRLERAHGGPVSLSDLKVCGDVRLALAPLSGAPDMLDYVFRRIHSERWMVRFCNGRRESVGYVAVSPYATDLELLGDSGTTFPRVAGGEFEVQGLPSRWEEVARFSPENAIILASRCTHGKVIRRPRLVLQHTVFASSALWEVVLERAARISVGRGQYRTRDTVYAGYVLTGVGTVLEGSEGLAVAADSQPSTIRVARITNVVPPFDPPEDWSPDYGQVEVPRDATIPTRFESATCTW